MGAVTAQTDDLLRHRKVSLEAHVTVRCETVRSGKEVSYQMNHADSILYPKDTDSMLLEHSKTHPANYMVSHPTRQQYE
jgi:hypothetical protein